MRLIRSVLPSGCIGTKGCFLNRKQFTLDSDLSDVKNEPIQKISIYFKDNYSNVLILSTATKLIIIAYCNDGSVWISTESIKVSLSDRLEVKSRYNIQKPFKLYDVLIYCLKATETREYNLVSHNCRDFCKEFVEHFGCKFISNEAGGIFGSFIGTLCCHPANRRRG